MDSRLFWFVLTRWLRSGEQGSLFVLGFYFSRMRMKGPDDWTDWETHPGRAAIFILWLLCFQESTSPPWEPIYPALPLNSTLSYTSSGLTLASLVQLKLGSVEFSSSRYATVSLIGASPSICAGASDYLSDRVWLKFLLLKKEMVVFFTLSLDLPELSTFWESRGGGSA